MIKRLVAWSVFALVVWAVLHFGSALRNPWAVPLNPVLSSLPAAAAGCTEDCK